MEPSTGKAMVMSGISTVSTKQRRIAELAKQMQGKALTSLSHHIDLQWLIEAHRRTRKDGAVGVDGQTASEYAKDLEVNLRSLLDRSKSGRYRAPSIRRVHIPKDERKTRPIGIPTFEEKVLQRAYVMLLEPVYEQEFKDFSYGFRPGRSPHDAVKALRGALQKLGGGWVLDVDVKAFFDSLDRRILRDILRRRVTDGVVVRMVGKWLNAGVLDGGVTSYPVKGTPQGGVISPLLANIYLHEVLDTWWEEVVRPRLYGRAHLVRYADDFVIAFELEEDALRVRKVLPKRFAKYGLSLNEEKTRMVPFGRPKGRSGVDTERPGTFDFLGFTHYWARSRKGYWVVKQRTSRKRLARAIKATGQWLRKVRHLPIRAQAEGLRRKLRGHYQYYGVVGNYEALARFYREVVWRWRKWLGRRSQKARLRLDKFWRMLAHASLPLPFVVHSTSRSAAKP
jgi:group II intron reverse transcriptase/maturase